MLNAVKDRNAIIIGVLEVPKLQHLWTANGPTPEALRIRDSGGAIVEPAVLTWMLLAFDLFNATGELTLNRMFDSLERDHLAIAFTLLIRVAYGEEGLNSIIENGGGEPSGGAPVH
ncbi:MAG: hypothetical protein Q8N23_02170 [Archangium sp.]|nr:hypothetical protein [Archangium sp.]MDP3575338.1 hypothetical protein [Archangium sp.]